MKRTKWLTRFLSSKTVRFTIFGLFVIAVLMLFRLGSLTGGLSHAEIKAATDAVGWHGIYHNPLYLPLKLLRSVVFSVFPEHGQTLTRLPNAFFGGLAIMSFYAVVRLWHGSRSALFTTLLFATSAWVLHASRLASFEVLYLWAVPTLLLTHVLLQRYHQRWYIVLGSICLWGAMLYIPGMVWLLMLSLFAQRKTMGAIWARYSVASRLLFIAISLAWLPLLVLRLVTNGSLARTWVGLPEHFGSITHIVKGFAGVPVHLFIRGPQYPELWLDRVPILDIFTLVICCLGLYFYFSHRDNSRSRLLLAYGLVGFLLAGLGGAVGLSILITLLYIMAAMGLAYLLREWLKVFPVNPLARGLGISLVALAISLSVLFNLRSYFVAWPHNTTTKATFQQHR